MWEGGKRFSLFCFVLYIPAETAPEDTVQFVVIVYMWVAVFFQIVHSSFDVESVKVLQDCSHNISSYR